MCSITCMARFILLIDISDVGLHLIFIYSFFALFKFVREFFAGQRSRVRKLVRLSCEKVTRLEESKTSKEDHSVSLDQSLVVSKETLTSVNLVKEEGCPSLLQEETIPGVNSDDKEFLNNMLNLMRKEQRFSAQVKLMEWVLCVQNSAVLNWFSNNGGITILATWLIQAAVEEQTTVLLVVLKVLYHLPVHKALPVHMSAIVPAVNRLRFYRTSDISNRARVLLSRWSKVFIRSQALKRPFVSSSKTTLKEVIHKQRYVFLSSMQGSQSCTLPVYRLAIGTVRTKLY
ncbi:hypothetical protein GW17_00014810 [Ensete ventricosum]|nr:hypothetical protein GW17_00014810 [Ensete ventricosum]